MSHWSDPVPQQSHAAPLVISPVDAVAEVEREIQNLTAEKQRRSLNRIESFFQDYGEFRRALYPKHLEYFRAGKYYRSRLFSAGNRCGKTIAGAFEMSLHLTGEYDRYAPWWEGRRFDDPIQAWACGTSNETTKNVVQAELMGRLEKDDNVSDGVIGVGTGMIPMHLIASYEAHSQIRGAIKTAWIRHISGKRSVLQFKSFEQGSTAFEGTAQHVVWGDEEIPLDIYTECLMRTMTVDGIVYLTSTPLRGLSDIVMQFMPDGTVPDWQTCTRCGKKLLETGHACPIQ